MNSLHKNKLFILAPLALATALAACGGGSSGGSANSALNPNQGRVSVLIADDVTQTYAEVWVTLKKVAAKDSANNVITLFDDSAGKVVNLSTLPNIGTLLSTAALPAGRYDDIVVTVDNAVQLVDKTGVAIDRTFSASGATYNIRVDGTINVAAGGTTTIALDFDLKQFVLDPASGIVTPVVLYKDDASSFNGTYAELEGRIQSVTANQFTFLPEHSATPITVTLGTGAALYDDATRQSSSDLSTLRDNDAVEIRGSYDPTTLSVIASRVALHSEDSSHDSVTGLVEVAGIVQSYNGGTLVLDVKKSDFVPTSGTVTIANVTNAIFRDGSLATLQASGQWLELDGTWDGSTFTAKYVNLDDETSSSGEREETGNDSSNESNSNNDSN